MFGLEMRDRKTKMLGRWGQEEEATNEKAHKEGGYVVSDEMCRRILVNGSHRTHLTIRTHCLLLRSNSLVWSSGKYEKNYQQY